ncbi:minor tail protein [Arthrobacter phage Popper]|uniref:Minor tail protein n=1 Tax=Arthrobacter phage Popper TaxID=2859633 RepID=A0AAE8BDD8_9CAUD|nr:minor tail protein [Arthrobacter phage Popper]QYC54938.1 minor tail protein [Arthrobacter phage Popper]
MPYPSPVTWPSALLYPGSGARGFPIRIGIGDLVLNNIEADGTAWTVNPDGFDGWEGSPAPTLKLDQRARAHGATESESYLTPRTMSVKGIVKTPTPALLSYAQDRLNAACSLDPFLLTVYEQERLRSAVARRQDIVMFKARRGRGDTADFSIQFVAKDPLKYGDLISAPTVLPFSSGGLVRPSTWPRTWTGVSGTGVVRINNPGNTQAPVWLRIDGPVPAGGWTVTHVGKQRSVAFASSLELAAGEFITVDMDRREILAQGQAARAGYITSRGWFSLDPGDNDIAFSAQNYSPTALLTVTTKPAWS